MTTAIPDPAADKQRLRAAAFARRDALAKAWRAHASAAIAERVLELPELMYNWPIGTYWPLRSEVDTRPILDGLSARGQVTALSQTGRACSSST